MDLPAFCFRRKAGQRRVYAALNHLCICPGSPDIGDYFLGAAIIGKNKSVYLAIKLTTVKEEVNAIVCSFKPAMQLPWLAQNRPIVFRTPGTHKRFCNPKFYKMILKNIVKKFFSQNPFSQ
jgi:hypothetical protein